MRCIPSGPLRLRRCARTRAARALLAGATALGLMRAPAAAAPLTGGRFEGTRFVPAPGDTADFGAFERAIGAATRAADASSPNARDRQRLLRTLTGQADSVAARFGERLLARTPPDSVAYAQVMLRRFVHRLPVFGLVDSVTEHLVWDAHHLLERQLGPGHPGLASSLKAMQRAYVATQNLRRAVAVSEQRAAILEAMPAPDSLELADALGDLGEHRSSLGDYARAESDVRRSLRLFARHAGPDAASTATAHTRLGLVLARQQRNEEALAEYRVALAAREKLLGPEHPSVAQTLLNHAVVLERLERFDEAIAHAERARAIWELPRNNADANVAAAYSALGGLYRTRGDYERARAQLERGLEVRRRAHAPNSPQIAEALGLLAGLLAEMGDYAAALPKREEALRIRERAQGTNTVEYANALEGYARLLVALDRSAEALPLIERAVATREKITGPTDPGLANVLHTRGDARRASDDPTGALADYRRAAALQRAAGADTTAMYAATLRRVGHAQLALHAAASAESAFTTALALSRRTLGVSHPMTIDLTDDLAHAQRDAGRPSQALATALRAEREGRERFALAAPALSERQALRYANVRPTGLPLAIGLAEAGADPARIGDVWEALAHQRVQVLDELTDRHQAARRAEDGGIDSLRRAHADASQALGTLLARANTTDATWATRVAAARLRLEKADAALGARSRSYRDKRSRDAARFAQIAQALPNDAALVAYTRIALQRFDKGKRSLDDRLVAFVLPGPGEKPQVLRVAETARVDSLVRRWRGEMRPPGTGAPAVERERAARAAGLALRRAVWDPVAARIGAAKRVMIVPEGELNLINFAALPGEGDTYLAESGREFHLLTSEQDMLRGAETASGLGMLAIGGVSFDSTLTAGEPLASAWRGPLATCEQFRSISFAPLPGTRTEVERVAALWAGPAGNLVRLEGSAATESAVKRLAPGRRIVHLATHGFFVDPRCGSAPSDDARGIGGMAPATAAARDSSAVRAGATERDPQGLEHPLRLSGLALAGANRRASVAPGSDDGILTAEELSAVDLTGVEWAVLSACETGVGTIDVGEGVFGLRRALRIAGARTTLSSLWAVEDETSLSWMESLYRRRLREQQDTMACVNGANRDELARRRRAGLDTHPFRWAGFVAAGDWR